jgi:hypothetical protein
MAGCGSAQVATTTAREAGSSASCAGLSPAEQLSAARLMFVGVMLPGSTRRGVLNSPARVRVERYLKGSGPTVVSVSTATTVKGNATTIAEDGIEPRPGERWQIYTRSRAQPFETSVCAGSARVRPGAAPPGASGVRALALWRSFPVNATPRPIVPLDEGLVLDPTSGFPTSAAKIAFLERRFVLDVPPPLPPSGVTSGRSRLVSARVAYRRLRAGGVSSRHNVPPLVINEEKLAAATFMTDRGPMRLPAWQFYFRGVADPAAVLALAAPALFVPPPRHRFGPPGPGDSSEASARLSRSGKAITISFLSAQAGNAVCNTSYRASAVADRRAVAFAITTVPTPAPGAQACTLVGYRRLVVLRLARPLGARVLVSSSDGGAISVTPG